MISTPARFVAAPIFTLMLLGAAAPETRVNVTLPATVEADGAGRLLLFVEPVSSDGEHGDAVDIFGPTGEAVSIAARDVTTFGDTHRVTIDTGELAYPEPLETLPPGDYRLQAVLDRNRNYNYGGRGPGDIVSEVVTVRFPLTSIPTIVLDHVLPAETEQFDVTGIPPRAAEQITASRPNLHNEVIPSAALTRFRGSAQSVKAWVLTPPGYDGKASRTYPTVYTAGGFGTTHKLAGQQLSRIWHLMETGAIPPMIWVALDFSSATGTTEFADGVNNGPWGEALTTEVIPTLEARYRMDAKSSGRFLTGHSSGGWFALWAMARYPALFGGSWATSPDPVDFGSFLGVDLSQPGANMYRDAAGGARPYERDHNKILTTVRRASELEEVLGQEGGQLRSFEWTFSPRGADGRPAHLFDRITGTVDPEVASYWEAHYDISRRMRELRPALRRDLNDKVHVIVGDVDSFYLDGAVHRLQETMRDLGIRAQFTYVPNATHSMTEVYARGGDRDALYKDMTSAMYAVARPAKSHPRK